MSVDNNDSFKAKQELQATFLRNSRKRRKNRHSGIFLTEEDEMKKEA